MKISILKNKLIAIWRKPLTLYMRKKLKNRDFVIISSNCIGGTLLHDLGQPFNSPTVNLTIPQFTMFCENLIENLRSTPVFKKYSQGGYPIFEINGIEIHGVHYKSKDVFLSAWERRSSRFFERVNNDCEILIFAADTQLNEENAISRFCNLPYRKIAFTVFDIKNECFLTVPKDGYENHVGDLTKYVDILGRRAFEKNFDCVKFINND